MLEAAGILIVTRQLQRGPLVLVILLQRLRAVAGGVRRATFTTTTLRGILTKRRRHDEDHTVVGAEHRYDVEQTGVNSGVVCKHTRILTNYRSGLARLQLVP